MKPVSTFPLSAASIKSRPSRPRLRQQKRVKVLSNAWRRTMRYFLALTLFAGLAFAASAPVRELTSEFPTDKLAHFRGGRLFQLGTMVRAYAPDGTRDFDAPILTP